MGGQRRPFYTDDGASAGRNAVVLSAREIDLSGADFVDRLMTMPFSGLIPMVPQFSLVGLGAYCDSGLCAIVIPYRFALEKSVRIALYDGPASDRFWNPEPRTDSDGDRTVAIARRISARWRHRSTCSRMTATTIPILSSSCPGYNAPTGAPISIQLGEGYGPDGSLEVASDSVTRDGIEIETV